MYKIKTINKISPEGLALFTDEYEVGDDLTDENGILVRSADLHDYDMPGSLLAIARAGAGVNNIPIEECTKKGIAVFNTPGANANAVKELVICSLFLSSRKIVEGNEWVKNLETDDFSKAVEAGKKQFVGPEINDKKLGVIGLGAIGVAVANAATKLGMTVYGYDPYMSVSAAWGLSKWVRHAASAEEIFKECDYITLHVPATEETNGMINAKAIKQMPTGVRILNFARGSLVNTEDMIDALRKGQVAKYVTDFGTKELAHTENCIVLPHLGASTPESENNCADMAVREMMDYLKNGNITNSVNMPSVSAPRGHAYRICVFHENKPNMLATFATAFGQENLNIEHMMNKARGSYAYTMIGTEEITDTIRETIENCDGVIKCRVFGR